MLSLAQISLVLLLVPLAAGLVLTALGTHVSRGIALAIAVIATLVAIVAAIFLGAGTSPDAPQILVLLTIGGHGLTQRIDSFTAFLMVGVAVWVTPVLIWVTTPRNGVNAEQVYSMRPMGLALIAATLAQGAISADNVLIIAFCWAAVGFIAWVISRPDAAFLPQDSQDWLDLGLMTIGPVLFALVMIFPMASGKSLSLLDLAGRNLITFFPALLLIVVLAFAAGVYPFTIWVRRVTQGLMTEAIAVLLLLSTPLAIVMLARVIAVAVDHGTWPALLIGSQAIPVSALCAIIGAITVTTCGIVLLFEIDLPIVTALLGTLVLGWCFIAVGTGDDHALIGLILLLVAYSLGVGTLLAVLTSLEWMDRDLVLTRLDGMARDLPLHMVALSLGALTLVGVPFLGGFAGMVPIDQGLLSEGGLATLAGGLIWAAGALALIAVLRALGLMISRTSPTNDNDEEKPEQRIARFEGAALLVPSAVLLVGGIAPELLFIGPSVERNPLASAASALIASGPTIPGISLIGWGFGISVALWLPGLLWVIVVVAAALVVLAGGLVGTSTSTTPVFAGGEPYDASASAALTTWNDLTPLVRSPLVLPGPISWREDLGEMQSAPVEEEEIVVEEAVEIDEDEGDRGDEEEIEAAKDGAVIEGEAEELSGEGEPEELDEAIAIEEETIGANADEATESDVPAEADIDDDAITEVDEPAAKEAEDSAPAPQTPPKTRATPPSRSSASRRNKGARRDRR
jgi:formate hydrogenlyase subunit 3/multisubunit Na+/H+ antiporter MnhD subunit